MSSSVLSEKHSETHTTAASDALGERVDARTMELQQQATELISRSVIDPKEDMKRERARASFDKAEIGVLLAGGVDKFKIMKVSNEALKNDPVFSKKDRYFQDRADLYERTLEQQFALSQKVMEASKQVGNPQEVLRTMKLLVDEPGGLDLHVGMFIPTILGQGDREQQAFWLPPSNELKIIGTYAQTELGHGTYLRGLETTATYDTAREEWILHSPTLTATKWWPGGLGKTATHAVVMARLFTRGEDQGPHAFVVQLRDTATHRPLPGIQVGDIGQKLGYNGIDNGFLRFDHVRLPRRALLMRHSRVEPDGRYVPPPVAKASYGTMVFVRSDIVMQASLHLSKAVTIAVRYNVVRRQSSADRAGIETQVIDYQHSQRTLFPLLATCYAFHFTGLMMKQMYYQFEAESRGAKGDFNALPELHATSSGLKAFCTSGTKDGIEAARLTCGGHGFSLLSGIPMMAGNYAPQVTYEGDNNVLYLQTARYLLKALSASRAGRADEVARNVRYLGRELKGRSRMGTVTFAPASPRHPLVILRALEHRANRLVCAVAADIVKDKLAMEEGMQRYMVELIRAAKAHCLYVVFGHFALALVDLEKSQGASRPVVAVLSRLMALYGLVGIEDNMGDFLEDGFFDATQASLVRSEVRALLAEIRPECIGLVDAFALDDYFLNSCLGSADGDVYQRLFDAVQHAPFNKSETPPGYDRLLKGKLQAPALSKL